MLGATTKKASDTIGTQDPTPGQVKSSHHWWQKEITGGAPQNPSWGDSYVVMRILIKELRELVRDVINENEFDDELNVINVGDLVDVDLDEIGILPVRVLELVDDVNAISGPRGEPRGPGAKFYGPGFVGEIDPRSGESGEIVCSLRDVVRGSKAKYYFVDEE